MTGTETNGHAIGSDGSDGAIAAGLIPQQRDAFSVYAEFYALSREISSTD
jgi:hypothetical protein